MSEFDVDGLVDLLNKGGKITKEELVSALNQIQFKLTPSVPEEKKAEQIAIPQPQHIPNANATPIQEQDNTKEKIEPETEIDARLDNVQKIAENNSLKLDLTNDDSHKILGSREELNPQKKQNKGGYTSKSNRSPLNNHNQFPREEFLSRVDHYQKCKERKVKEMKEQLEAKATQPCTFCPNTVARKKMDKSQNDFYERLAATEAQKTDKSHLLRYEQEEREAFEFNQSCTFRPYICSATGKSKYWKAALRNSDSKASSRTSFQERECTFTPATNRVSAKMKIAHRYLSMDPYKRLSQSFLCIKEENEEEVEDENDMKCRTTRHADKNSKNAFSVFIQRQNEYERAKELHKNQLIDLTTNQGSPYIDKKSVEIATSLASFDKRNQQFIEKQKMKMYENEEEADWFHPKLIPRRKMNSTQSIVSDYIFRTPRKKDLNSTSSLSEEHEIRECSFRPKLFTSGAYSATKSTLRLSDQLSTFSTRLSEKEREQEAKKRSMRYERELREDQNCTHKPRTTPLPQYLRIKKQVETMFNSSSSINPNQKSIAK